MILLYQFLLELFQNIRNVFLAKHLFIGLFVFVVNCILNQFSVFLVENDLFIHYQSKVIIVIGKEALHRFFILNNKFSQKAKKLLFIRLRITHNNHKLLKMRFLFELGFEILSLNLGDKNIDNFLQVCMVGGVSFNVQYFEDDSKGYMGVYEVGTIDLISVGNIKDKLQDLVQIESFLPCTHFLFALDLGLFTMDAFAVRLIIIINLL